MNDSINRAETLEAIKRYFRKAIDEIDGEAGFEYISNACEAIMKYTLDICKMIEALPSAEPKQPDSSPISCISAEKMHDRTTDGLISRQAAIDEVKDWYDGFMRGSFNGIKKRLESLPSAQPEIVRCCKCGFWDRDTLRHQFNDFRDWNEAECEILVERDPYHEINRYTEADDFCSYAERKR